MQKSLSRLFHRQDVAKEAKQPHNLRKLTKEVQPQAFKFQNNEPLPANNTQSTKTWSRRLSNCKKWPKRDHVTTASCCPRSCQARLTSTPYAMVGSTANAIELPCAQDRGQHLAASGIPALLRPFDCYRLFFGLSIATFHLLLACCLDLTYERIGRCWV